MIDKVNWNNLQPYKTDQKKSFEELCYQIVSEENKDAGTLTRIDDSGGGDGVEFYLTLINGDVWGWQAKFIGRLDRGGRKEQIKNSLQTSCKKHPKLKKWFLCSKKNFTMEEQTWFEEKLPISKKNGVSVVSDEKHVELIHWGDTDFLNYLRKYPSIYYYFFNDNILGWEWFKAKYDCMNSLSELKAKYESLLHIETETDDEIIKILGGKPLANLLNQEIENQQVEVYINEYQEAIIKLKSEDIDDDYKEVQKSFIEFTKDKADFIENGLIKLNKLHKLLVDNDNQKLRIEIKNFKKYLIKLRKYYKDLIEFSESDVCKIISYIQEIQPQNKVVNIKKEWSNNFFISIFKLGKSIYKRSKQENISQQINYTKEEQKEIKEENNKRRGIREILFQPLYIIKNSIIPSFEYIFRLFELIDENEFHISGAAGMGKTHVAFNIFEKQIKNRLPAIFIFAKNLRTEEKLEKQIKDNLEIPSNWSLENLWGALNIAGAVYKSKIPIIIDGLNESTHWRKIWKIDLEKIIISINNKYKNIVLITTYRTSYEDQLFPKNYFDFKLEKSNWKKKAIVRGFENLTWDEIQKYFDYYKIKLQNYSEAIGEFWQPLYLKLFCETKNPQRQQEVKVSFVNEDLFEVFDQYLLKCNSNICSILSKDEKFNKDYTKNKLLRISQNIWDYKTRGIPNNSKLLNSDELRAFEGENLLIYRDWNINKKEEEIQFTYDLFGGYLVAKYLILKYKKDKISNNHIEVKGRLYNLVNKFRNYLLLIRFIKSKKFYNNLLNHRKKHPLFNDILRCIVILFIKEERIFLFKILKNNKTIIRYSMESLFEINSKYIKDDIEIVKKFLTKNFRKFENRNYLFGLAKNIELDINHPLNFDFWSGLLKSLSISERDLSWSEYVRHNHNWYENSYFTDFVKSFENACRKTSELSDRAHLAAKKVMWILSTNIKKLRDEATRALYYYSRKYPKEFLELLKYGIDINDPYVPERILAVSYGLAMARQNDFDVNSYKKEYLPKYAKFIFDNMFADNAPNATTHILTRDYAKRTIDIALIYEPNLFTEEQKTKINYPLSSYTHKIWGESKDKNKQDYRDGNAPINMDFENYTIGRLVEGRSNYDNEHLEYMNILSNIYWRIYNLGYSLEKFSEIDKRIARENWNYTNRDNIGKIDRYGKKYSWIAFYEMAGYRSDLGLLTDWDHEDVFRISDVDIDPSFPIELKDFDLMSKIGGDTFLGDQTKPAINWYDNIKDLDMCKYLIIQKKLFEHKNSEWVLLKGFITKKDENNQKRDVHISIDAVFVSNRDILRIQNIINEYSDYQFSYIRPTETHYLYEGEIPWSELMPYSINEEFDINYNYYDIKRTKTELQFFKGAKKLTKQELINLKKEENKYVNNLIKNLSSDIDVKLNQEDSSTSFSQTAEEYGSEVRKMIAKKLGYTLKQVQVKYIETKSDTLNFKLEKSIFENSWESYHSEIIPSGSTISPSKQICNYLTLFIKPQTSDFYDVENKLAATTFKYGEKFDDKSIFIYIRKDLIEKYLKYNNKDLLWFQWSEKRYFKNGVKNFNHVKGESEFRVFHKIYEKNK